MPCVYRNGVIMCSRTDKMKCEFCGKYGDLLCDGKKENGKTCDKVICRNCATKKAHNVDLCPKCEEEGRNYD